MKFNICCAHDFDETSIKKVNYAGGLNRVGLVGDYAWVGGSCLQAPVVMSPNETGSERYDWPDGIQTAADHEWPQERSTYIYISS